MQKSLEEGTTDNRGTRLSSVINPWNEFKPIVHHNVIQALETTNLDNLTQESLRSVVEENLDLQAEAQGLILSRADRQRLVQELIDEILGFGPITSLLHDPGITEIMVNGPYQIYIERNGKLERSEVTFSDDKHVLHIIEKIVAPLGRRIDESQPMVDARLPDGSRVNAIIPPLALNGPTITIRKFSSDPFKVEDLINFGTLTSEMACFLEACVRGRLNILVSGGTGSGKTTTLGVLSSYIPEDERIITIEDAAELQLRQSHVVTLETRPANIEGKGAITIRDLVRNALRMRPERIIVGEVRSGEALDMLQAMNTGHDGSLTTGHANTPRDMLARVETMVLMAGMDLPVRAIREQISSAIDLIVQQSRLRDGSRRITHITEVLGMEGDIITLQDIFRFEQTGIDTLGKVQGNFRATGIIPHFIDRLNTANLKLPENIFINF
jgi:Flp pilus assembly protein, ATPase CpaF